MGSTVLRLAAAIRRSSSLPLLFALPACLLPLTWADSEALIQTGDYNNPINASRAVEEVLHGWQPDNLGEPSFRLASYLFPYLAFWWGGEAAGLEAATTQRLWLVSLFALAMLSAWSLLRLIVPLPQRRPILAALALLAYAFNPLTLTYWAIGYQLAFLAYAVAPLWLAAMARVLTTRASWTSGVRIGLISLLFASAFSNPPSVVIMIVLPSVILAGLLVLKQLVSLTRIFGRLVALAPWLIAFNAWWLIPVVSGFVRSGYSYAGESGDLFEWPNFTNAVPFHEFVRGTGFWGFHTGYRGVPYFDWSDYLAVPVVIAATLWLAACALVPLTRRRWWSVWSLVAATLFMLGVFLAKGTNAPLGELNRWLYLHVPGFFLFRGTEKFAGLQFLAILIGLGILHRWTYWKRTPYLVFCALTAAGIALSAWPLIVGTVVQPRNQAGVSAEIQIPGYYDELNTWLRGERPAGALLVVPQTPTGYLKTTWGFAGADLIRHYSPVPVIVGAPEARARDGPRFAAFLGAARSFDQQHVLARLGVSHVLVRGDIDETYYPGTPSPRSVEERLIQAGFPRVASKGPLRVYEVPGGGSSVRASAVMLEPADHSVRRNDRLFSETELPIANANAPGTPDGLTGACVVELPVPSERRSKEPACRLRHSELSGEMLFARHLLRVRRRAGHTELDLRPLFREGPPSKIDQQRLTLPLRRDVAAVRVDRTVVPLRGSSALAAEVGVYPSTTLALLGGGRENLVVDESFEAGSPDGLGHIGTASTVAELRVVQDASTGRRSAELRAARGVAFVKRRLERFDSAAAYSVSFDYRHVRGGAPGFGIWQNGIGSYAVEERDLLTRPGWHHYQNVFLADPGARSLHLFLYSFARGRRASDTVNRFDNVIVRRLEPVSVIRIGDRLRQYAATVDWAELVRTYSAASRASLSSSTLSRVLRDPSFEQTRWGGSFALSHEQATGHEAHLSRDAADGRRSLEIVAVGGGAAVAQPLAVSDPENHYRLSFRYKHITGKPPAFGVWANGADRYAESNFRLSTEPGWQRYETTISPPSGTRSLSLFLYSFSSSRTQATRNRYDDVEVSLTPVEARFVIVEGPSLAEHGPTVAMEDQGGAVRQGVLHGLDGTAWVLFSQAFDRDWVLEAKTENGSDVTVGPHLRADGFGNAWRISGRGDVQFTIAHKGGARTRVALFFSATAILVLGLGIALAHSPVSIRGLMHRPYVGRVTLPRAGRHPIATIRHGSNWPGRRGGRPNA